LHSQLRSGRLDHGPVTLGAELELYITDTAFTPLHANRALLDAAGDPLLQLELNRFNLEYNLAPQAIAGAPFSHYARAVQQQLARLNQLAGQLDTPGH